MRINGNEFKIDTVGQQPAAGTDPTQTDPEPTAEEVERALQEDFFMNDPASQEETQTRSTDPLDDFTFDQYHNSAVVEAENATFLDWLGTFPPTLEYIITNNPEATNYLGILKAKYETGLEDISKIKVDSLQKLQSGALSASEAANANSVIEKCEAALIRINTEIEKTNVQQQRQIELFDSELNAWKDFNNDGKIADVYLIRETSKGETVYIDIKTGKAVASPMFDPDYEPALTADGAMVITDSPRNPPDRTDRLIDCYLQLTPEALNNFAGVNEFGTPAYITPPMAFWVQRDTDSSDKSYEIDTDSPDLKMKLYDKFVAGENGAIKQEIPADREKYTQVKVAKIDVLSTDSGPKDADGNTLYNTEVEFRDCEGVLIARIRIEGFETTRSNPAAAGLRDGSKYVAASSVGFGIYNFRGEIDATQYVSTCKQGVDNLAQKLGVTRPSDTKGAEVFDANMEVFSNSGSRYVAADADDKEKTGIFVGGYSRGIIDATRYSDVIKTCGVNDFSDAEKERMPEDSAPMGKTDGLYANFVHANTGAANIVVGGNGGDNYIFDASFAWFTRNRSIDEIYIAAPKIKHEGTDDRETVVFNPQTFIYAEGGKVSIDNPSETDFRAESEALDDANAEAETLAENREEPLTPEEEEREVDELQEGRFDEVQVRNNNDCYIIADNTSASFTDDTDDDIVGNYTPSTEGAVAREDLENLARDRMDAWRDEMSEMPEIDEAEISAFVAEDGAATTELFNETNGFFDSMFGEWDETVAEQDAGESEQ